jgi:hypothetical protein
MRWLISGEGSFAGAAALAVIRKVKRRSGRSFIRRIIGQ